MSKFRRPKLGRRMFLVERLGLSPTLLVMDPGGEIFERSLSKDEEARIRRALCMKRYEAKN